MVPKMTVAQIEKFLDDVFPQIGGEFSITDLTGDGCNVWLNVADKHLRPGGTVSGPSMFALVDIAMYVAVLSRIGPVALAVTTNCSIDFMRKPLAGAPIVARARLLKLGRSLAVGDVLVFSNGQDAPVARASLTYAIPPDRSKTEQT